MNHLPGCCVDKKCDEHSCMTLPGGSSCGTCGHLRHCKAFGFTSSPANTRCDFYPRRYLPMEPSP